MCGIHASISTRNYHHPSDQLHSLLCKRGPDHVGSLERQVDNEGSPSYRISFASTVLALRGGIITPQPFADRATGSVLCWNGEAWTLGSEPVKGNDGQVIFDALIKAVSTHIEAPEVTSAILGVLRSISGPFAFVFFDSVHGQFYFARDRLGRRSLLWKYDEHGIEFASVADSTDIGWAEIEADGMYQISCSSKVPTGASESANMGAFSSSPLPAYRYDWDSGDSPVRFDTVMQGGFHKVVLTHSTVLVFGCV